MRSYNLIDSGNLRKLEAAGEYTLIRPALNAFWRPELARDEWDKADGVFIRDKSGSGKWEWRRKVPSEWTAELAGFNIKLKPTGFGHLGFFAEQAANWQWFSELGHKWQTDNLSALNLFGYSGIGSLAMAKGGFEVCHLDAAKGMNDWGKENLALNPDIPDHIRWIADDVLKFCNREVRRKNKYRLIALDPPTFGRGASAQVWKIEEDLLKLLYLCRELVPDKGPFALALSCHSPGFSLLVFERLLRNVFGKKGVITGGEMFIPEAGGERKLPAGVYARLEWA